MTYYAMTTTYPQRRAWRIVGVGSTADEAGKAAQKLLGTMGDAVRAHDIYAETELINLTIKSKTAAIREAYIPRDFDPAMHPAWQDEENDANPANQRS